ncbi:MAG: CDP-archaeol synthase [Candidatus Jacksonbacteria bacterium]|nr:CDP-archaeol synthase [Candidatus Jacksonbacteria bacterium]
MTQLASIIWLLAPGGIANIAAALIAKIIPSWSAPVDFGKSFAGNRVFGDHKTWRGLIGGTIAGGAIFLLQRSLSSEPFFHDIELFEYKKAPWFLGLIMGFGALFGDLVKSFIKRRLVIAPGRPLFALDQIDWVFGTLIASAVFLRLDLKIVFQSLIVGGLAHIVIKYCCFLVSLDKKAI